MNFNTLKNKYDWKEINGCPGRFILKNKDKSLTIEKLVDEPVIINTSNSIKVKDFTLIVKLEDGGIISYKKSDGYFIHTLNTIDGFHRKLKMLDIDPMTIK
jgi:hypothetical protein